MRWQGLTRTHRGQGNGVGSGHEPKLVFLGSSQVWGCPSHFCRWETEAQRGWGPVWGAGLSRLFQATGPHPPTR